MTRKGFLTSTDFAYFDQPSLAMMPLHTAILFQSSFSGSTFYHYTLTPSSKCVSICLRPLTKIVLCPQSQVTAFLPVFVSPPYPLPPLKASPLAFLFSMTLDLTHLLVHSSPSENSLPFVALELTSPTAVPQVLTGSFQVSPRKPDKM